MDCIISLELAEGLVSYMSTKPYSEVSTGIEMLKASIHLAKNPPAPTEEKRPYVRKKNEVKENDPSNEHERAAE
jgi:hypothetical protein